MTDWFCCRHCGTNDNSDHGTGCPNGPCAECGRRGTLDFDATPPATNTPTPDRFGEGYRAGVEAAGKAQANLVIMAKRERQRRQVADEAFDLIAPFVAKFAEAAGHYDGGRPRFEGGSFTHDADPSFRPALTSTATGLGGPGAPQSPTIGDLRLLAAAYEQATAIRALHPATGDEA